MELDLDEPLTEEPSDTDDQAGTPVVANDTVEETEPEAETAAGTQPTEDGQ